ncbi:hypothetical protein LY474_17355 [Myxococcus stipitatus]|uniref:hypothetical protein n=1 Tax=Myxococcus stipitatus TaxID=83455 RepID=UPI001F2D0BBC|nr:hypothetical protein [Myxococcus stipitatus]MCE9669564.1 hypothetical protein [Myxococcus stipitatus]
MLAAAQLTGCTMLAQTSVRAPGPSTTVDPALEVGAGLPYATVGARMEFASLDAGLVVDGRAPLQLTDGRLELLLVPHLGVELLSIGRPRNGALGYLSPRAGAAAGFLFGSGNPRKFLFVDFMGGYDQPFSPRWRRWYGEASVGIGLHLRPWIGG